MTRRGALGRPARTSRKNPAARAEANARTEAITGAPLSNATRAQESASPFSAFERRDRRLRDQESGDALGMSVRRRPRTA